MNCIVPTDKRKREDDILVDALMNINVGITEPIPYEKILKVVSDWYDVDWIYLAGICKKFGLVKQKRICMYLMYELSHLRYDEIAEIMGQKDNICVTHGIRKITILMRKDEKLRNEVLGIVEKLK